MFVSKLNFKQTTGFICAKMDSAKRSLSTDVLKFLESFMANNTNEIVLLLVRNFNTIRNIVSYRLKKTFLSNCVTGEGCSIQESDVI